MKRSEPLWKRKAARQYMEAQRNAIFDALKDTPPIHDELYYNQHWDVITSSNPTSFEVRHK